MNDNGHLSDSPPAPAILAGWRARVKRFDATLSPPLGALVLDSAQRISASTAGLEESLGYGKGSLLGMPAASLIPDVQDAPFGKSVVLAVIGGDSGRIPLQLWKARLDERAGAVLCVIADRRRRRLDEPEWLEAEAALAAIHSIPFPLWITAVDGRCVVQNEASRQQWRDLVGKKPGDSGLPKAVVREWEDISARALTGERVDHEWRYTDETGSRICQNIVVPVAVDGRTIGAVGVSVDITERKQAEAVLERWRHLFETANFGMAVTTADGIYLNLVNAAFARMHGFAVEELVDKPVADAFAEEARTELAEHMHRAQAHGHDVFESTARRRDGSVFPVLVDISIGRDEAGETLYHAIAVRDITERVKSAARVVYLATHDELTGLLNRSAMVEETEQLVAAGGRFCLCMIDLDRFKVVNDSLGHRAGDMLLKEVARRLQCYLSRKQAYRLGGDEFALLIPLTPEQDPIPLVQPVVGIISKPCVVEETSLSNRCSIGVSVYPDDADSLRTLLRNADIAMYRAKHLGGNSVVCFSGERRSDARSRLALEADLRTAAEHKQLVLHYEPKVSLADGGGICGMEVLLRWNHPLLGRVSPALFIPLAEETGLIGAIGEWVLETACRQNHAWLEQGYPPLRMAVNLSARQFNPKLLGTLRRVLKETGHPPELLELEITESTLILNVNEAAGIMHELVALGVRLSVDDFGTGYSALSYLKNFPVSSLKLNASFIRGVAEHAEDHAIVRAVVALAHTLKLSVVAECVEKQAQLDVLRELECDQAQGYLFSPPVATEQFEKLLREELTGGAESWPRWAKPAID